MNTESDVGIANRMISFVEPSRGPRETRKAAPAATRAAIRPVQTDPIENVAWIILGLSALAALLLSALGTLIYA